MDRRMDEIGREAFTFDVHDLDLGRYGPGYQDKTHEKYSYNLL
jgi:hypothetical protein